MPRLDLIHNAVKNALIRDGWEITADPLKIEFEGYRVYADLGADFPIAAEREDDKIAVEAKSFIGRSPIDDLEKALGQYNLYVGYLEILEPDRKLYLAISERVYEELFTEPAFQVIVKRYAISLLVVNLQREEIVLWKSSTNTAPPLNPSSPNTSP